MNLTYVPLAKTQIPILKPSYGASLQNTKGQFENISGWLGMLVLLRDNFLLILGYFYKLGYELLIYEVMPINAFISFREKK